MQDHVLQLALYERSALIFAGNTYYEFNVTVPTYGPTRTYVCIVKRRFRLRWRPPARSFQYQRGAEPISQTRVSDISRALGVILKEVEEVSLRN